MNDLIKIQLGTKEDVVKPAVADVVRFQTFDVVPEFRFPKSCDISYEKFPQ